jgi:uroporphyrinogen decarboxylase
MGSILEISDKYDYTYIRSAIDFVTRKWIKCPVETHADWAEMKKRYDPDAPQRVSGLTPDEARQINARDSFLSVHVNGPFWQLREWLGFENLCAMMLDDPGFVLEMIGFWQDYIMRIFEKIFAQGITLDGVHMSEDMAYKAHSMISPAMTREFLLPVYKKWIMYLKSNGVKIIDMDSDGYIAELIPIWIEAGINVCDPIEAAAHNDIVSYSKAFGKKMAYTGGVDKRAIAAGGKAIEDELKRIAPVIEAGGFIPSCDHGVPSDISLENFIYYSRLLAKYTGWL